MYIRICRLCVAVKQGQPIVYQLWQLRRDIIYAAAPYDAACCSMTSLAQMRLDGLCGSPLQQPDTTALWCQWSCEMQTSHPSLTCSPEHETLRAQNMCNTPPHAPALFAPSSPDHPSPPSLPPFCYTTPINKQNLLLQPCRSQSTNHAGNLTQTTNDWQR